MGNFEIRPISGAEELLRYKELCSCLYRITDSGFADRENYKKTLTEWRAGVPVDDILLGAYENGVLYAGMHLIPYTVNFDGKETGMCGIGGVISDPAVSGKGAVKELFAEAFRIMRAQGRPLSHLYPFETGYYRRYGYESSCSEAIWSVPVSYFQTTGVGRIVPFDNSPVMKEQIRKIYASFGKRYNFSIVKSESDWERFFADHQAFSSGWFSYLHETDGEADAFLSYRCQPYPEKTQDLVVPCLWFSSLSGLRELFSYFKTQIPYADRILLTLPQDVDLSAVIGFDGGWGKRNSEATVSFLGISRAVDIEKLLASAKIRYGAAGTVTVRIIGDSYCPWNNGVYTVPLEAPGKVTKEEDRGQYADIDLTPNSFVSLFFGRYGMDSCELLPGVTVNGSREKLSALFYPKPCFIDVHF